MIKRIYVSGTVIHKNLMKYRDLPFEEAQATCNEDTKNVTGLNSLVGSFLSLPRPRNDVENKLYADITDFYDQNHIWLDIAVDIPTTLPIPWIHNDSSPVEWLKWDQDQPEFILKDDYYKNNDVSGERISVVLKSDGFWADSSYGRIFKSSYSICTYFLPAGAENTCNWLQGLATGMSNYISIVFSRKFSVKYLTIVLKSPHFRSGVNGHGGVNQEQENENVLLAVFS